MPLWAASSFLSPPSLASGLSGSALSTKSTRSTQSPARQYVARLRGSKPPGPAACQGHDHFPDRGERAPGGGRPRPAWNLVDGHGPTRLDPDYGSTSLGMENPVQRNSLLSWSPGPPTHLPARQPHTGTSSLGGQQHLETNICTAQRSSEPGLTCRPPPWWETGPAARRKVPRAENIGQREGCRSDEAGRAGRQDGPPFCDAGVCCGHSQPPGGPEQAWAGPWADMAACRSPSVHP
ncbi:uncharacterized protein LOC125752896 isoform X4 [Canis lupus dingo]|uniref:uncharacterized protein LOC125752896 isoform X4 n=1 Tax=Canis lupus dingo TaxID=286419 RepID=UPI0020C4F405|nr:uncharacterized protein LOC125752896 isoform X4 [Canis lupus dingo]